MCKEERRESNGVVREGTTETERARRGWSEEEGSESESESERKEQQTGII